MPDDPQLMSVFAEALERTDPVERAAYLDQACGDDAALRRRVDGLIASLGDAGRFLEPNVTATAESIHAWAYATYSHSPGGTLSTLEGFTSASRPVEFVAGQVIAGRYTLLGVLGQGGMGTVYRAEQAAPVKRLVALKLIRVGMDSRKILARFDAERQALAMMDHPNIARVFDGGTTEANQPFFVMELVDGEPITHYCDRKRLPVRSRLELFVAVCVAMQHAHQKGIIHRDLKPGNVLVAEVDGRATPKVIDFGVAKATEFKLTDQTLGDTGAIVGTPTYMSPEQADPSSMDIDTRTDVYALGVLLYELLSGSPPIDPGQFRLAGLFEMLRMVREVDPPKPSTRVSSAAALPNIAACRDIDPAQLKRELQGDLDWIVMKALEKDRTRRYDTANGFAADVLRHLAFEPVQAAPPSRAYQVRKFVRKNRGMMMAASLVLLALLVGLTGTTWGLFRADRALAAEARRLIERDEALKVAERARAGEVNRVAERDEALRKEAERVKERDGAISVADARAEELRYRLGVSEMVLAANAFDHGDVILATERLANVPPGQRGWEWHYLKRQTSGGLFPLHGHAKAVWGGSFSPDGSRIVTASSDETARVWDARTGETILELRGHAGELSCASFSPDGSRIVTGSADGTARVWDARTGATLLELKGHASGVRGVSFSPDGSRVVTGSADGTARVWDARTGETILELKGHASGVRGASFSPDGSRIVTGSADGTARVWDARTGGKLLELKGHASGVRGVSFSPDGSRVVTGGDDGTARVWGARTGATLLELKGHASGVRGVSFSPDGSRIVTGGDDGTARVWDARTGGKLLELKGHTGWVTSASFSPDGSWILTGSIDKTARVWAARADTTLLDLKGKQELVPRTWFSPHFSRFVRGDKGGTARICETRTGATLLELKGHAGGMKCVSFGADGSRILIVSREGTARVWDARTGAILLELGGNFNDVSRASLSPDGARVVTIGDDGTARVWDARTGAILLELRRDEFEGFVHDIDFMSPRVSFSPDGSRILAVLKDGSAWLWDARTGAKVLHLKEDVNVIHRASFSHDGLRIVTGGQHNTARVWDAKTGAILLELEGHTEAVWSASFSPDGSRIITGSLDKTVRLWDARTGMCLLELKGHAEPVVNASFSPDGSRILTACWDGATRLREAPTGPTLPEFKGHTAKVWSASFSPDGSRIITGSSDQTARVWDAKAGTTILDLKEHTTGVVNTSFSSDGSRVLTLAASAPWKVWDATTGRESKDSLATTKFGGGPISPDGRFIAHPAGRIVELISLRPNEVELEYRRFLTRPNLARYREGYDEARKANDSFAARFYLNLLPPAEREQLETIELDRAFPADPFAR